MRGASLLLSILLSRALKISSLADGVIWSKRERNFVPLFSVPVFASLREERRERLKSLEHHNFQREALKISYYQETNLVSFVDNDTRITGVCGELWNILADYLNFTLIPIKLESKNFGLQTENGSYDGILGLIQSNVSQIIPRSGVLDNRLSLLEYTFPLWTIRYHLYIKPEWRHDQAWMFHLFPLNLWYSFFSILLILSIGGYVCEKVTVEESHGKVRYNLQDHVFYTVAIASSQGSVPTGFYDKSRIVYLLTCFFSWIILIAFNSHAIYLMMNKKYDLPFSGLRGLIRDSKYEIVAFSGSMMHQEFEDAVSRHFKYKKDYKRVKYIASAHEMYEKVCFNQKGKLAAFEAEDRHKAIGRNICRLIPTQASYFETWIASAVKRGFRYKRSFDVGILKLSEAGIIDGLKERWLDYKYEEKEEIPYQSIDVTQVYLIFGIWFVGLCAAIIVLIAEYLLCFGCRAQKIQKKIKKSPDRLQLQLLKNRTKQRYSLFRNKRY